MKYSDRTAAIAEKAEEEEAEVQADAEASTDEADIAESTETVHDRALSTVPKGRPAWAQGSALAS